jgi:hypothetical protein
MHAGESGWITIDGGAEPLDEGSPVWIMLGSAEGLGDCPAYLGGGCWSLLDPVFANLAHADGLGVATWNFTLHEMLPLGTERAVQAAFGGPGGVRLSNAGTMTVTPAGPAPGDCTISGSIPSDMTLVGAADPIAMAVGWDGTHYYATNGGSGSNLLYRFNQDGSLHDSTEVPFDQRSAFSKSPVSGPTYLRRYSSHEIRIQGEGVTYDEVVLSLTGAPSLASQSRIAFDWVNGWFINLRAGGVDHWDEAGAYVGHLPLPGWAGYDNVIGFADNACYITFDGDTVSSWNLDGSLAGVATLEGSGAHYYSLSYANGHVWRHDGLGWKGYPLGI